MMMMLILGIIDDLKIIVAIRKAKLLDTRTRMLNFTSVVPVIPLLPLHDPYDVSGARVGLG